MSTSTFAAKALAVYLLSTTNVLATRPATSNLFSSSFGLAGQNGTFDYVIVGGGTSGLTTAARLSANGSFSVAIIEAGGFYEVDAGNISTVPAYESNYLNAPPTVDWKIYTTNQAQLDGRSILYSQGKTLGGSSARNGMAYSRGTASSYDMWANLVGDSSYRFEELLPYFKKSVQFSPPNVSLRGGPPVLYNQSGFSSTGGPLQVSYWNYYVPVSKYIRRGLESLGFKENGQIQNGKLLGFAQFPATLQQESQLRDSSQTSFLNSAIATFSGPLVYPNTLAKQILFDGKKATGVRVNTAGWEYILSAKKEVILAAGPFHSPQLLMVSGVGPEETLQQLDIPVVSALPGVGQNLMDNAGFGTLYPVNAVSQHRLWNNETYAMEAQNEFYNSRSGPLTAFASNYILWEIMPNSTTVNGTTRSALSAMFPSDWPDLQVIFNAAGAAVNTTGDFISVGIVILKSTSLGSVSINSSDTADRPLVDVNWFDTVSDQQLGIQGLRRARVFANATGVLAGAEVIPGPAVQTDEEILEWIKTAASPSHHAAGTCKMGLANDTSAVVDSHGCVMGGISGLRVVDISTWPVLPPSGAPVATVYAIAEKLAQDVLSGHKCV
ncbi:41bc22b2-53f8-4e3f-aa10-f22bb75edc66 [Sclerotinia trifoliorum]|uniref:41bc22b2-53f8-4e3f-aa10-f22bb75edc66 n=1 Tax=Sclerotinia trifoliorum TaxID=28548 RepID=A0A8H2VRF4_9HELO|nr:41bc22b2-53f8-4e3f-aa10-f22bb75edc66 [Sclerotinia trifoliorum]